MSEDFNTSDPFFDKGFKRVLGLKLRLLPTPFLRMAVLFYPNLPRGGTNEESIPDYRKLDSTYLMYLSVLRFRTSII